jgi:hypothetical protein
MTKQFVPVGFVKAWPDANGKPVFTITAPVFHLPPGTVFYIVSDTLDPPSPPKAESAQDATT